MPKSSTPPPWPNAARRTRRVFRPYGQSSLPNYTVDTWTTPDPSVTGYRVHEHTADDHRRVLFEGVIPAHPSDADEEVRRALERICVRPGDEGDDVLNTFSADQLDWSIRHAEALRREARDRLGWSEGRFRNLHADIDAVYRARRDLGSAVRYEARAGVVVARGRTARECSEAFREALSNHISAEPTLRWGPRTGCAYLLYPSGGEWVIRVAPPGMAPSEPVTFRAEGARDAERRLSETMAGTEGRAPRASARPRPATGLERALRASLPPGVTP